MIYDKEGGRAGVCQFLIFGWQEGEWWSGPQFLADIICEQPLLPERCHNDDRTLTEQWQSNDRTMTEHWLNNGRIMSDQLQNDYRTMTKQLENNDWMITEQ